MKGRSRAGKLKLFIGTTIFLVVVGGFFLNLQAARPGCNSLTGGKFQMGQVYESSAVARGNIYDRNYTPLAVSFQLVSMFARPLVLADPDAVASQLAPLLEWQEDKLRRELRSSRGVVWLADRVQLETEAKVMALGIEGIYSVDDSRRLYPRKTSAAQAIGFHQGEQGLAGVELEYDLFLRGEQAMARASQALKTNSVIPTDTPSNLALSLDLRIQGMLEKQLKKLRRETFAEHAMALVMDPISGEILAMVNQPSFDPNRFWDYDVSLLNNRTLAATVNPGELRRLFRIGAAVKAGLVSIASPGEESDSLEEATIILPRKMKETRSPAPYGIERAWTFVKPGMYVSRDVAKLPDLDLDKKMLANFASQLGFNQPSNIDLPSEKEISDKEAVGPANFSLKDQEGATSAIHLLSAFSRLSSGNIGIRPHLFHKMWEKGQNPHNPEEAAREEGVSGNTVFSKLSNDFLEVLAEKAVKGPAGSLFYESLVEENEDLAPEIMTINGISEEPKKYQWVLLGAAPYYEPEVTLLLVLEGAQFDPERSNAMRKAMFSAIGPLLKRCRDKPMVPDFEQTALVEKEFFAAWHNDQRKQKSSAAPVVREGEKKMPNVLGMSLRNALHRLDDCDLAIRITGAGRVTAQTPLPGVQFSKLECLLELQVDH